MTDERCPSPPSAHCGLYSIDSLRREAESSKSRSAFVGPSRDQYIRGCVVNNARRLTPIFYKYTKLVAYKSEQEKPSHWSRRRVTCYLTNVNAGVGDGALGVYKYSRVIAII